MMCRLEAGYQTSIGPSVRCLNGSAIWGSSASHPTLALEFSVTATTSNGAGKPFCVVKGCTLPSKFPKFHFIGNQAEWLKTVGLKIQISQLHTDPHLCTTLKSANHARTPLQFSGAILPLIPLLLFFRCETDSPAVCLIKRVTTAWCFSCFLPLRLDS